MITVGKTGEDLFLIDNARNLTRDQLASTFVPTKQFWRLFTTKNQIILGNRGSGKTAMARMLSHDHLSLLDHPKASHIIKTQRFIGIYAPTRVEWVSSLHNKPWNSEAELERHFQWRLNITTCLGLIPTLQSCLMSYFPSVPERARKEREISLALSKAWLENEEATSLQDVQRGIEDVAFEREQQIMKERVRGHLPDEELFVGTVFATELFSPLRYAIKIATRSFGFPPTTRWLMCLDETEYLDIVHHRILNTHLRAYSGDLVFKIMTQPYKHPTYETNTPVQVQPGHDFEYVYIDQDPISRSDVEIPDAVSFASDLFRARAHRGSVYQGLTLSRLLGRSALLDEKEERWERDSSQFRALEKYASKQTQDRALRLLQSPKFGNEISRKIGSALILREAIELESGNTRLSIYSGLKMAVRCGDGNPRRLIQVFGALLSLLRTDTLTTQHFFRRTSRPLLPPTRQNRALMRLSYSTLSHQQSAPIHGPDLVLFISNIGEAMRSLLHQRPLTTDQVGSFLMTRSDSPENWELMKDAVAEGLAYPNVSPNNPDMMPEEEGEFRIAYILAPRFRLLPRRGVARRVSWLLRQNQATAAEAIPGQLPFPTLTWARS